MRGPWGRDIWRLVLVIRPGERAAAGIVARHMLGRRLGGRLQGHAFPAACSDGHHPPAIGGQRFQVTVREARAEIFPIGAKSPPASARETE